MIKLKSLGISEDIRYWRLRRRNTLAELLLSIEGSSDENKYFSKGIFPKIGGIYYAIKNQDFNEVLTKFPILAEKIMYSILAIGRGFTEEQCGKIVRKEVGLESGKLAKDILLFLLDKEYVELIQRKECPIYFPRLAGVIEYFPSKPASEVFRLRLHGFSMIDTAEKLGMTRNYAAGLYNRFLNSKPRVYEDLYAEIFCTYEMTLDEFGIIFNQYNNRLNQYLSLSLRHARKAKKRKPLAEIMESGVSKKVKERCTAYLSLAGAKSTKSETKTANEEIFRKILEYIQKNHSTVPVKIDDIEDLYFNYLKGLPKDSVKAYKRRFAESIFMKSPYILMHGKRRIRYYDTTSFDINAFIDEYKLYKYEGRSINLSIFINKHRNVLQDLEIQNSYELHNLIRKNLDKNTSKIKISMSRMPMIEIRGKQ